MEEDTFTSFGRGRHLHSSNLVTCAVTMDEVTRVYLFSTYENMSKCSRFFGEKKQGKRAFTVTNTGFW